MFFLVLLMLFLCNWMQANSLKSLQPALLMYFIKSRSGYYLHVFFTHITNPVILIMDYFVSLLRDVDKFE